MRAEDFKADAAGSLVQNLEGRMTFRPHPLPPPIVNSPTLLKQVSAVDNLLGRIDGKADALPDKQILIRSFVRREAQLSSYIENTYARYEEVAAAQRKHARPASDQVRETVNAEQAITAGVEAVFERGQPVTLNLIRQMHGVLLSDVRGHESRGRFREIQVFIGRRVDGVEYARFVPPAAHLLVELMGQFEQYLTEQDDLPAVIQLALLHYQFETIHPFEDGNGRLGRILILLGLCQYRLLTVPLLNPSLHFERNRQTYYDALLRVSTHGDWTGWLTFFVEGLRVAATESMEKLRELTELQRDYHARLRAARNSALLLKLVDNLFISPVITIPDAAEITGLSYHSAKSSVQKLVNANILRPIPDESPALFSADAVLKAVNPPPTH